MTPRAAAGRGLGRWLSAAVGVLLLAVLGACGQGPVQQGPGERAAPSAMTAGTQDEDRDRRGSRPSWSRAVVVEVIDGDTLRVRPTGGAPLPSRRVRLIGVDAPEVHPRAEPYGRAATRFTRQHLLGREVWLERDVSDTDRYGRALRYVWLIPPPKEPTVTDLRRHLFNAVLLLEGYGQVVTYPPDVRFAQWFLQFQREARQAGRGLWSQGRDGP